MKIDVLLGLQWGDEGKGKIVDVLTPDYDIIARFQGGPNAGHTLEFNGQKQILHTIPSGIFHPEKINLIGNGVVLDPFVLSKEAASVLEKGVDIADNVILSRRCHLILPSHRLLDAVREKARGDAKIGSTLKGIGPAYSDKTGRKGLRVGDLEFDDFNNKYQDLKKYHLSLVGHYGFAQDDFKIEDLAFDEYEKLWFESLKSLKRLKRIDSEQFLAQALADGKKILAEGAQGSLLDIDFGSYPFVTSSNTTTGGVCTGLGVPPSAVGDVYGVFKAYCTRVGSGPFPTELNNHHGEMLRMAGREFGSTTGRPRRCGWLDLVSLRYAVMLNGVTKLIMTKADVLNEFPTVQFCEEYDYQGEKISHLPFDISKTSPIWKEMPGWGEAVGGAEKNLSIPDGLEKYICYIENELKVPVSYVSVGPDRLETIKRS